MLRVTATFRDTCGKTGRQRCQDSAAEEKKTKQKKHTAVSRMKRICGNNMHQMKVIRFIHKGRQREPGPALSRAVGCDLAISCIAQMLNATFPPLANYPSQRNVSRSKFSNCSSFCYVG